MDSELYTEEKVGILTGKIRKTLNKNLLEVKLTQTTVVMFMVKQRWSRLK